MMCIRTRHSFEVCCYLYFLLNMYIDIVLSLNQLQASFDSDTGSGDDEVLDVSIDTVPVSSSPTMTTNHNYYQFTYVDMHADDEDAAR